ncbi:MAG: hypothetical protein ACFFB3_05240 [Candidatus Hodarchaeota archaeon]
MLSTVTIAKVISLAQSQMIPLPPDFLDSLLIEGDESHAVMILMLSTNIIRIIPTKSSKTLKVVIEVSELSATFLQELGIVFMHSKLKTLYSTGLCFTHDTCVYEAYIDVHDLSLPVDQFKIELANIKGVSMVNIELLTME